MRVTILPDFVLKSTILASILGAQALPQRLNGLRRDYVYAPAAYNPVYGPLNGIGSYIYGGNGPQPTVVNTFSSSSSTTEPSEIKTTSSIDLGLSSSTSSSLSAASTPEISSKTPSRNEIVTSRSTSTSDKSTTLTGTASSEFSSPYNALTIAKMPLVCNHDNCLREFLQTSSVTAFCATYTMMESMGTTGLPSFVSHCSGLPTRISSACSCLPTATSTTSTSMTGTLSLESTLLSMNGQYTSKFSTSASNTTCMASRVEPTTTTVVYVTVTSPITILYTPTFNMGTGSSGFPSSTTGTSAWYPLSNHTSLLRPTGTNQSFSSLSTALLSPQTRPNSSALGTAGVNAYSPSSTPPAPYPLTNFTSFIGSTGSSAVTGSATTLSYLSSPSMPTYSHDHYHTGKSLSSMRTEVSMNASASASTPSMASNLVKYKPTYALDNSSSAVGTTGISPASLTPLPNSASSTNENSLVSGSSTSMSNSTLSIAPVGTGSIIPQSSNTTTASSSMPHYFVPSSLSSFSSQTGSSLPTLSSATPTTGTSMTAYDTGISSYAARTGSLFSFSPSSFGSYTNFTSPATSSSSISSSSTAIVPTMPVYALPTHHEGHHKQHGDQYYNEDDKGLEINA